MPLEEYRAKRDFQHTAEPAGGTPTGAGELSFVVQEHHARALHYDVRLELDGVLMSWAVPKGPSLDPHDKRLAVHVEDHPLDYANFEGPIPAGEYGAGKVIVWDRGTWEPLGDPHAGMERGDFKFTLSGEKLHGLWVLVRIKPRPGEKRESWLLIKEKDEFARPHDEYDLLAERPESVISGLTVEHIKMEPDDPEPGDPKGAGSNAAGNPGHGTDPQPVSAAFMPTVQLELATLVDETPAGDDWISEVKYDGYRVTIALENGKARAFTRHGADWSDQFAPLVHAVEQLPAQTALLDGEAVVFDADGVSRFELLHLGIYEKPERLAYAAFDLLYLNGYDLRRQPLVQRKELLKGLLGGLPNSSPLRYADHVVGGAEEFFRQACASDLEGIVAKRAGSHYIAGRGRDWLKIKCKQSQEFVVGGFTEGAGSRTALGSLLVGTYDGDRLVFAGRVGSGLNEATVKSLRARLNKLERKTSPFDPPPTDDVRPTHWTRPEIVIQAAFREWTSDGRLRQPVVLGVREDKPAREVVHESPTAQGSVAEGGEEESRVVELDPADPAEERPAAAGGSEEGHAGSPTARSTSSRGRVGSPPQAPPLLRGAAGAAVLGVRISNPEKPLFPDSLTFTKLDLARYYESVAPVMLPEILERPLTLVRCPVGHGQGCFYQRHPDVGTPAPIRRFPHAIKHEEFEFLYIDSAEGLIALAQMGVGEIHTWLSHVDAPRRPDRICFDLDPGADVAWPQICSAARLVREECDVLGFHTSVKSTGSKGLHVVMPIEPVWEFERIRALSKAIVDRLVAQHPETLVGKMAKDARGGRVFFDYLRNAEGASAVAAYSTRMKPGPSCAVPLAWEELTDDLDIRSFTPAAVIERVASGTNPWRDLEDASVGVRVLRAAESKLAE